MEQGISTAEMVSALTKSPHGDLKCYLDIGKRAALGEPLFFSHLISWNRTRGQVRDAKVALPVIAMGCRELMVEPELAENACAHVAGLGPREMVRAVEFAREAGAPNARVKGVVGAFLRSLEGNAGRFERVGILHHRSLKTLYARLHIKPSEMVNSVLFKGRKPGLFGVVSRLSSMDPLEAAGTVIEKRIPFLVAYGALGNKLKDVSVLQALINSMTPVELVTNAKALETLGVGNSPVLRATMDAKIEEVGRSRAGALKTAKAASATSGVLQEKLAAAQERQLDALSVQGDWLVLADRSGSMAHAMDLARQVAALLARVAAGRVHMVFYNQAPTYRDVTGKSLEEILAITRGLNAHGGTVPGVALAFARASKLTCDGIAMVGDGNENFGAVPPFVRELELYEQWQGKSVPLYLYRTKGDPATVANAAKAGGIDMTVFDLSSGNIDYNSLPNLVATMRTQRYSLLDEINEAPLLRLADVLK